MNFFEHQDRARRKTTELIVLFNVAVILIVVAVDLVTYAVVKTTVEYQSMRHPNQSVPAWQGGPQILIGSTAVTLLIIFGGSAYKMMQLAGGGPSVAQMLGGRPINPNGVGRNDEAMLQNVVEEMSIASGVPMPQVYVLDREPGINAFAAGFTTDDAVIAVTRGALSKLTRDELQGVIGHEFSHILNGDMRLNLRLIGILGGIQIVSLIGYVIVRTIPYTSGSYSRSRDRDESGTLGLLLFGALLVGIGWIGAFFARMIQAAVSRQREFLADASAVQFTRNPAGLVGALQKLGEHSTASKIRNAHALETAHLFFANSAGMFFAGLLETHPPLEQRIKRLDPMFDGTFVKTGTSNLLDQYGVLGAAATAGLVGPQHLRYAAGLMQTVPDSIARSAREPYGVRPVIFCLLASADAAQRAKQLEMLRQNVEPGTYQQIVNLIEPVTALGSSARLPLLNLALPALRELSDSQAKRFLALVRVMIESDGQVTLFEFALHRLLEKQLAPPEQRRPKPIQYFGVAAVRDEAAVVLSALAAASTAQTDRAFDAGAKQLGPEQPPTMVGVNGLKSIDDALQKLARSSPSVKKRFIDAAAATIMVDGEVNVAEAELLRATAATLDVPIPPLLHA